MKKITLLFSFLCALIGFSQPTTNAPAPIHAAADVISIYGDTYTNIATNYDPNWGQTGHNQVNPNFSVGNGNVVLAYPNFNYQGTELTTVNAAAMEFLHVDIWTSASPTSTIVQVSPINNGTGTTETLVTINHVSGQWFSVDIPKSAFTGMTWNSVFQLKFAANGPGSTTPATIYLDNIYFWKAPIVLGTDATLSDLKVSNTTISNFSSATNEYAYSVPQGSAEIPQLTATSNDPSAAVVITQATSIPGNGTVQVTSQNGLVVNTYTVSFSFALPTQPSGPAPTPTKNAADVISIYGDTYTNIATNYNPNWGQSGFGQVNPNFSVGNGNVVLAYPNFNYQGTELTTTNAAAMEFLHVDIWTNANPNTTIVQVSPINNGTGTMETLVTINHVAGEWYSVDIPKSAFTGMTWNSVFQLKFAANGAGSTTPATIYLDNIYFWKAPIELGADATLSDLKVDGSTVANFSSLNNNYNFEVPQGTMDIPQVTATSNDPLATVVITQATSIPGDATVVVTSENDVVVNTYTVSYSFIMPTAPMTAAPTPQLDAANVLSLFSNAYTNVAIDTWLTAWSAAALEDLQIEGNDTKKYSNLNFAGIEMTGNNSIDATDAEFFHVDFWTANVTTFRIKLVDFGPNNIFGGGDDTEHEVVFSDLNQYEWVSLSIPVSDFVNLTNRANISQLIISGLPVGAGTIFIDNVYFSMPAMTTELPTADALQYFTAGQTLADLVVNGTNLTWYNASENGDVLLNSTLLTDGTEYYVSQTIDGQESATLAITVQEVPFTEIIYNSCGTTLPNIASNLTLRSVQGANMYKISVKNMTTDEEVSMEQSSTLFKLTNFSNVAYGTAFEVKAQVSINSGATYFAANTPCTITTPAIAVTPITLLPGSCGNTVLRLNQDILTPWVNDNALYCFHVSLNGEFVEEVEMPTRRFRLTNLTGGVVMGETYEVKVRVKLYGSYSEYGSVCNVLTPSVPTTQLSAARCNSVIPGLGTVLRSAWVNNDVQAFMFAIVDGEMNVISEVERATEDVTLLQFPDFTPELGMTYNIRVKVKIGNTWGEYGSVCTVATAALESQSTQVSRLEEARDSEITIKAFPNPFSENLNLLISGSSSNETQISWYDVSGKRLGHLTTSEKEVSFGHNLSPGIYFVNVVNGTQVTNIKVIKK